jgi:hypothetical protein
MPLKRTFVALAVGAGLAATSLAAFDAQNANRVDGKHAVGAGASVAAREGKLVATSNATGRLPNNIIARAPDAAKLGGKPAGAYRSIQLMPQGAFVSGVASIDANGFALPAAGTGTARMGFVVPPDYPGGNAPLRANLVFSEFSAGACSIAISTAGLFGPDANGQSFNGAWFSPVSGLIEVPSGPANTLKWTLTWPGFNPPTEAGQFMQFAISRVGDDAADTCGAVSVRGVLIRY